ncbi:Gfo/Idh/MocA family protein [Streptomyces prunicolor]|uniref:Gfo/Idh/MocA family oxidoreductase n=1 Tax=Streptomyces prunicolor TaxID=67348 RepID=A0ABU4FBS6_9ACTN|nr:Gfo/Idh/MocA family oxidoreductase [Streptomyces prunicolor]MDV7218050.1 Gfo/Idh/MocA family oxidoreductase [Streptomyces prunicolor]
MSRPRSGIIGAGFIGEVHARAVRAAGGTVTAVATSTASGSAAARDRLMAGRAAESADELIHADDVDLVHICTPNHLHTDLALKALAAGKHVICEKPLATDVDSAQRLTEVAAASGAVAAVPFVYRYYSTVQDARGRVRRGDTGELRLLHGSYLQDWLADPQDSDWRVDPGLGGVSRAFGDIGVHWCDLVEFTTGHRIQRLSARLLTAHAGRRTAGDGADGAVVPVGTEDVATVLFETDRGALGSVVISQITHGRKNRLWFSLDGTDASLSFDQELPESLWVGGRSHNSLVSRGSSGTTPGSGRYDIVPSGHPQGYQDCFTAFVADVHRAARLTAAVLESAPTGSWVDVKPVTSGE